MFLPKQPKAAWRPRGRLSNEQEQLLSEPSGAMTPRLGHGLFKTQNPVPGERDPNQPLGSKMGAPKTP